MRVYSSIQVESVVVDDSFQTIRSLEIYIPEMERINKKGYSSIKTKAQMRCEYDL